MPRRSHLHEQRQARIRSGELAKNPRAFDYSLDYKTVDLRARPELYRVGVGEQGVLLVEPFKAEILPHWHFATVEKATESSQAIYRLFEGYRDAGDFVGMDMARKFLQMGFTRARRYANHRGGRKYDEAGAEIPRQAEDPEKAAAAAIFFKAWKEAEADPVYAGAKKDWRERLG